MKFRIGSKILGQGQPCFIIAEAGSNHNGSLKMAKALIKSAAWAGANAIKFQLFKAEDLSSQKNIQDTLRQYEFHRRWLPLLSQYARTQGILFSATPFDRLAVTALAAIKVPFYKIASGDLTNWPLIACMAQQKIPLLISVGLGNLNEIREALQVVYRTGNRNVALLHCIVRYPAAIEELNLRVILTLYKEFQIPVGLSDHTMDTVIPSAAVALGACFVEKHFTLSRKMTGPDHPFALEPEELKDMVIQIRKVEKALGSERKQILKTEKSSLFTGRRGLYAKYFIARGSVFDENNIAILRPSRGIKPKDWHCVIGKKSKRDIAAFEPIFWKDLQS